VGTEIDEEKWQMSECFRELIAALCALVRIEDPGPVLRRGVLTVDGVGFSLTPDDEDDARTMLVQADCGMPEQGAEASVYAALLQQNYAAFQRRRPLFAVCPAGGIVSMARVAVAGTSAAALAGLLTRTACHAGAWRSAPPAALPPTHNCSSGPPA
jgi:hypothetical protein